MKPLMKRSIAICLAQWLGIGLATAQQLPSMGDDAEPSAESPGEGFWNLPTKTLGGKQFWTDVENRAGWRVQRNAFTGHFRLLDANQVRRAWGEETHCRAELQRLASELNLPPYRGKVVILLHGLMRSRSSLSSLETYLAENGHYQTINFQYASSRQDIAHHAAALDTLIGRLGPDVTEIDFVAHRLGNIVVRRYLYDLATCHTMDPRFKRMVMLGPPNQGSQWAVTLRDTLLFKTITGVSGQQLGKQWATIKPNLATPSFEFGIVSGGGEQVNRFEQWMFSGPSDYTVSVEETLLPGAADQITLPVLHGTMMNDPAAQQCTLQFLQHGYLVAADRMHPLPADAQPLPSH